MTLKERNIWHLPLLILAFWLGGCSMQYEDFDQPQQFSPDLNLVLNIRTGDRTIKSTRTDEVEFEDPANERELLNTLRVIIVNNTTGNIAYNEFIDFTEIGNKTPVTEYSGLRYVVDYDTDYTVYLVGNEDGLKLPNGTLADYASGDVYAQKSPLEDMIIKASDAGQPILGKDDSALSVPMTEIFPIHTVKKEAANPDVSDVIQNETFFITRAACKFSFYFFRRGDSIGESDNRVIESVKITGLGLSEYLFPYNVKYVPGKDNRGATNRDIIEFSNPTTGNGTGEFEFSLPNEGFKVSEFPNRTSLDLKDENYGVPDNLLNKCTYAPAYYFPESKGGEDGKFYCTIKYAGEGAEYTRLVELDNLPHALPRNTHVVVIITISDIGIEATVDVIPFTAVVLNPDYGLEREEYTGYIVGGKDELGNQYWYDANYYEDQIDPEDPPVKYYLGPTGSEGQPVTINDKQYMLVYADIKDASGNTISGAQRSAANLHHFFEVFTEKDENEKVKSPKKHLLTPVAITGYEDRGAGVYINKWKQRVVLKDDLSFTTNTMYMDWSTSPPGEFQIYFEDYSLSYCRTLDEWDFVEFTYVSWDHKPGYYPKYWYDILGIQHRITIDGPSFPDFPSGDSVKISEWQKEVKEVWNPAFIKWIEDVNKEKAKILGDWVKYLQ